MREVDVSEFNRLVQKHPYFIDNSGQYFVIVDSIVIKGSRSKQDVIEEKELSTETNTPNPSE